MLPVTRPVSAIATLPVATMLPSYTPMMTASTVWTLALTTPFSPMTSLPPTDSSPPTSHSIWIESVISNLPSSFAEAPTMVSRGPPLDAGPAELSCDTSVVCGLVLFRPSIATSSGAAAAAALRQAFPNSTTTRASARSRRPSPRLSGQRGPGTAAATGWTFGLLA